MCLAVPGRVIAILDDAPLTRRAEVDFGGVRTTINLAFVPEAAVGDYVLAHVGVAIARLDPDVARRTLAELGAPAPPEPAA
ncbi:MAG: HypC/HybG/HupF family hydrogenase formation chaperone [Gammaproteobacteria bacterium]|nr:HypC/HybG/HupF family hydrogenase formation chaperone [Gammaproteobacteria bacterium]MCP5198946.1 HypC/HybG/HupF family hydrogenase formation chaperone [Gammaproteobacteria bacterium]